jgi:hypothetical protein
VNQTLTAATPGAPGNPTPDQPTHNPGRPIGGWAFLGVTVTSLGGPLALAALYAPSIVAAGHVFDYLSQERRDLRVAISRGDGPVGNCVR